MAHSRPVDSYHIELVDPVIRVGKDMAHVAYTLHLRETESGVTDGGRGENVTRIFQYQEEGKLVHFHRS